MTWHSNELSPGNVLVQNGALVVGSIRRIAGSDASAPSLDRWRIEILFDGGDIVFEVNDYVHALAFVEGVERTTAAFLRSYGAFPDPLAVIALLPNDRSDGLKTLDAARRLVERFKR